jgi:arylsulfatase A-like enzyme
VLEDNITNVACPPATAGCPKGKALIEGDGTHWCKVDTSQLAEPLADDITANVTIGYLQRAKKEGKPFFIASGFHKPHLPFHFPAEFDIYPPADQIKPPLHADPPKDMPQCAWHEGNFDNKWGKPCDHTGEYRRAYYSAVSYTDSLIGKVLDALEHLGLASDTAVALIGDHGWQLGEMNLWRKMTNFELGVRVPLIFRAPWAQQTGAKTPALAEAVDVFPTLVELAGLPPASTENLQGSSLAQTIAKPPSSGTGIKKYAFSQFAKASTYSRELGKQELWDVCTRCNRDDIEVMGFSIRSDDWRLSEWVKWNAKAWVPLWDDSVALELYNHAGDFGADLDKATPTANVAADPAHADIVKELRAALRKQFHHGLDDEEVIV